MESKELQEGFKKKYDKWVKIKKDCDEIELPEESGSLHQPIPSSCSITGEECVHSKCPKLSL